jgi:hypothetical protein
MPKRLTVNIATQPPGHPIEVLGLGIVENGTTVEIPDDRVATFENTYGLVLDEHETIEPEQAPEGPTEQTGPPPVVVIDEDAARDESGLTLNDLEDPNKTAEPKATLEPTAAEIKAAAPEHGAHKKGDEA